MNRGGSGDALQRVRTLVKLFRYAVYVCILCMLWWLFSNFSFIQIEPGDDSVMGVSGFRRVLIETEKGPFERGEILVFAIRDVTDRAIYRISRVLAAPGDAVTLRDGCYAVNGASTEAKVSASMELGGKVPQGFYLMINDNSHSEFADSRRLGLLDQQFVMGRFLSELPF
jgi:signal peptidase I